MVRAIQFGFVSLALLLMWSSLISAAPSEWRVLLQAHPVGSIPWSGNCYIGTQTDSVDSKDPADVLHSPLPSPYVMLYELRNDSLSEMKWMGDIRSPYSNATKVWSNWQIYSTASQGTRVDLTWTPHPSGSPLPAGSYRMIVTFAPDVTGLDGTLLGNVTEVYDLSVAGSRSFLTNAGGIQIKAYMVCRIGNGPDIYQYNL